MPPTWNNDHGSSSIGNHVNAVVGASFDRKIVVDFNAAKFRAKYPSRAVSDRYAVALFYNNLGAEALIRQQYASSFALLREAARTYADMPAPWVNLGVLYARAGALRACAEAAYLRALEADSREQSALANLVSVYSSLGETALADEYRQRIRRYREINPYYHYAVAQIAYDERRFEDALARAAQRDPPEARRGRVLRRCRAARSSSSAAPTERSRASRAPKS